jgi:hypothetical protein
VQKCHSGIRQLRRTCLYCSRAGHGGVEPHFSGIADRDPTCHPKCRCSAADKSERRPSLIRKKGLWVYTGEIPPGYDILQAINEKREERMRLSEQEKDKTPAKADAAG